MLVLLDGNEGIRGGAVACARSFRLAWLRCWPGGCRRQVNQQRPPQASTGRLGGLGRFWLLRPQRPHSATGRAVTNKRDLPIKFFPIFDVYFDFTRHFGFFYYIISCFLLCLFLALIHQSPAILSFDIFICISSRPRLSNSHDDHQGFVGTPGPTRWRGSPACFAAESPPPRVSFFRVFGPWGLQPMFQQSAPRLGHAACRDAGLVWRRLCGASFPRHTIALGA